MSTVVPLASASREFRTWWDEYVDRHPSGWFWHTSAWLDYQVAYRGGNENHSFAVMNADGGIGAAVPLILSRSGREYSFSGEPAAMGLWTDPASRAEAAEALRLSLSGVERSLFCGWESCPPERTLEFEVLRLPGACGYPAGLRVVDLGRLNWSEVRDSYRSLINSARRELWISTTCDRTGSAGELFAAYSTLHRSMAGAFPRPDETYRLQGRWAEAGAAFVSVLRSRGTGDVLGAAYWNVHKGSAYYSSGSYAANDVAHAQVWTTLERLRAAGVKRAVVGWQGRAETDKLRGIEFFKRGFGGRDKAVSVVEVRA